MAKTINANIVMKDISTVLETLLKSYELTHYSILFTVRTKKESEGALAVAFPSSLTNEERLKELELTEELLPYLITDWRNRCEQAGEQDWSST